MHKVAEHAGSLVGQRVVDLAVIAYMLIDDAKDAFAPLASRRRVERVGLTKLIIELADRYRKW